MSDPKNEMDMSIDRIAEDLSKIEIKDRKYHLQTYKDCWVGSDAVDLLIGAGHAKTREDAVKIGKTLQKEMHLFEHVTRDHDFADGNYFFTFTVGNARGTKQFSDEKKKFFEWSDFLDPTSTSGNLGGAQPKFPAADFSAISEKDVHVASSMWPMDVHNRKLLDQVHPPSWQDPPKGDDVYDLVVLGAGAGGLVTSAGAAGVGAKVALIEAHFLGGDCLNIGCVPSKALIHAANLAHTVKGDMANLAESGISIKGGADAVEVDFGKVMERLRRIRAHIAENDSADRYTKELGVDVFIGYGKFTSSKTVIVNGRVLEFRKAVVATGGYPSLIPMPGLKELHQKAQDARGGEPRPNVMTNESVFNLTALPKNMAVIGAGVIGMEIAQSMARLGSNVTVFGRSGKVLPKEDEDMAELVKAQMTKDGVSWKLNVSKYLGVEETGKVLDNGHPELRMKFEEKVDGKMVKSELVCDAMLVAAGRRPNVTGMNLEAAGIKYCSKKGLEVNDQLRTTNPRVYGVGDVCSEFKFTHAADFMARMVIRNTLFFGKNKVSDLLIPYATFTAPEIASVGLYESDLKERGIAFKTYEKPFADNDRAICDSATTGMVRVRVDAKSDKILGASILGEGAGNMISEITLAMQSGTGLGSLAAVIHPYPTTAEAVRQSGDLYNRTRLTTTVKGVLRGLVKVQRTLN